MQNDNNHTHNALAGTSAALLICGVTNAIVNILRRVFHLITAVSTAAEMNTDYSEIANWKDIILSVYDIAVIFNLSFGIIAVLQIITAIIGFVYSAGTPKTKIVPFALGVICTAFGILSVTLILILRSMNIFLIVLLIAIQLIMPIVFTKKAYAYSKLEGAA